MLGPGETRPGSVFDFASISITPDWRFTTPVGGCGIHGSMNQLRRAPVEGKRGVSHLLLLGILAIVVLVFAWLTMHPGSTPASQHTLNPTSSPNATPPSH